MSAIHLSVSSVGTGKCSLSGKDGDGLVVSLDDGTVSNQFLSWKSFRQLLAMKAAQGKPAAPSAPKAESVAVATLATPTGTAGIK